MKRNTLPKAAKANSRIADPDTVLKAAMAAPTVFSIGAYFTPLYIMRQKGHSWRYLADWLRGFNIELSHVHLHRLYVAEDARLDEMTENELVELGMPREMIESRLTRDDPNKRLIAPDPRTDENEGAG